MKQHWVVLITTEIPENTEPLRKDEVADFVPKRIYTDVDITVDEVSEDEVLYDPESNTWTG